MTEYNDTELAILEAAEEIFLEKGYNGASTTKIAGKAGVTHAMLHYYFRTKEQIFLKILDKEMGAMLVSLKSIMTPEAGLWETLRKAIELHFDFLNSHRRLPFLVLDVADSNPEMFERYKEHFAQMIETQFLRHAERLREAIDCGEMNPVDPMQLLCTIVSCNVSAFTGVPFIRNVMKMDDAQVDAFLERRKEEIVRMVHMRLFAKGGGL